MKYKVTAYNITSALSTNHTIGERRKYWIILSTFNY